MHILHTLLAALADESWKWWAPEKSKQAWLGGFVKTLGELRAAENVLRDWEKWKIHTKILPADFFL